MSVMSRVLVMLGGVVTVVATLVAASWAPPPALVAAVVTAAVVVLGSAVWLTRHDAWADRGMAALLLAWLYGVPFLLGVGLLRRGVNPPVEGSFEWAKAYAARTDALMISGLVLNVLLPAVGAMLARWRRSWVRRFAWAGAGAVVLLVAFPLIAAQADAGLFGRLPRWEKP
jgi:hypothetical protein